MNTWKSHTHTHISCSFVFRLTSQSETNICDPQNIKRENTTYQQTHMPCYASKITQTIQKIEDYSTIHQENQLGRSRKPIR